MSVHWRAPPPSSIAPKCSCRLGASTAGTSGWSAPRRQSQHRLFTAGRPGRPGRPRLGDEPQLALMANCEDTHLVARDGESVQGHIARATVGDHKVSDFACHAPPEQRMRTQRVDSGPYCRDRVQGRLRVLVAEESLGTFEMTQGSR